MSENILLPTSSIPASTTERLRVREKIGFAFGDAGLGLTNQSGRLILETTFTAESPALAELVRAVVLPAAALV